MIITAKMLREKGASCLQVATFEKEWPKGGKTTLKNIQRAAELSLDLDWFASHFLSASARAEFYKATAPARAEYEKATASARAEFYKATAPARAEYEKATAPARAEYEKAMASALYKVIKQSSPTKE
jgi:uncharacterized membrane protein YqiK